MPTSRIASALGAAFVLIVVFAPALEGGFLADDYYVGREIQDVWESSPSPFHSMLACVTHRWTEEFDVFRPLSLLTLQADYALFGPDGGRHHLLNVILWALAAFLVSRIAVRLTGRSAPTFAFLVTVAVGCFPAGVETLGWLVAREDLLAAVMGLFALRAFLASPDSPWARLTFLALALASKETAVVMPLILGWIDLCGYPRDASSLPRRVLRHIPDALLLVGYLTIRFVMFGRVGGDYGGKSFRHYLVQDDVIETVMRGLITNVEKMIAPLNLSQAALDLSSLPSPRWIALAAFLVPPLALLGAAGRTLGWRPLVAFLGWILLPLALLAPIPQIHVGQDMSVSRILLLPSLGYLLFLALAASAALGREHRLIPAAAAVTLVCLGATALRLNLGAYRDGARQAEEILGAFGPIPEGQEVWICGHDAVDRPGEFRDPLVRLRGSWVLSAGLFDGLRPPFRPRGLTARALPRDALPRLLDVGVPRPWLVRVTPRSGRLPLRATVVASGGGPETASWLPELQTPPHGSALDRTQPPSFTLRLGATRYPTGARWKLQAISPLGGHVIGQGDVPPPQTDPATGSPIPIVVQVEGEHMTPPLTPALLALLPDPVILWWVVVEVDGIERARSPYQVLSVR